MTYGMPYVRDYDWLPKDGSGMGASGLLVISPLDTTAAALLELLDGVPPEDLYKNLFGDFETPNGSYHGTLVTWNDKVDLEDSATWDRLSRLLNKQWPAACVQPSCTVLLYDHRDYLVPTRTRDAWNQVLEPYVAQSGHVVLSALKT